MSYTIWNYQYYLGRYPENKDVIIQHDNETGGDFHLLRDKFITSPEYQKKIFNIPCPEERTFFLPQANSIKICVLGNCQGPNIAAAIAALAKSPVSVCGLEIMNIEKTRDQMLEIINQADVVVCCKVYSPIYIDIAPETIQTVYKKKTLEYSPVHFTGIQPDILTLGSYGKRVQSPLGDYNSRIILSSYILGLSLDACIAAFNETTYINAGYFYEFEWSSNTMKERENNLDADGIRLAEWFLHEIYKTPLLYSINHPNSRVFSEYAVRILDKLGIDYYPPIPDMIYNSLVSNVIWPIDPIIARANNVNYSTNHIYWKNKMPLPLDEFVWRSYKTYDHYGQASLAELMGERIIKF